MGTVAATPGPVAAVAETPSPVGRGVTEAPVVEEVLTDAPSSAVSGNATITPAPAAAVGDGGDGNATTTASPSAPGLIETPVPGSAGEGVESRRVFCCVVFGVGMVSGCRYLCFLLFFLFLLAASVQFVSVTASTCFAGGFSVQRWWRATPAFGWGRGGGSWRAYVHCRMKREGVRRGGGARPCATHAVWVEVSSRYNTGVGWRVLKAADASSAIGYSVVDYDALPSLPCVGRPSPFTCCPCL